MEEGDVLGHIWDGVTAEAMDNRLGRRARADTVCVVSAHREQEYTGGTEGCKRKGEGREGFKASTLLSFSYRPGQQCNCLHSVLDYQNSRC